MATAKTTKATTKKTATGISKNRIYPYEMAKAADICSRLESLAHSNARFRPVHTKMVAIMAEIEADIPDAPISPSQGRAMLAHLSDKWAETTTPVACHVHYLSTLDKSVINDRRIIEFILSRPKTFRPVWRELRLKSESESRTIAAQGPKE